MAKFDLSKGSSVKIGGFDTSKDDLTKLQVELTWTAGKDTDLDATTFLLGASGEIIETSDFVYYKSDCREKEFDINKFGSKKRWRAETRPMSSDGAVLGSIDDLGDGDDDDDSGEANETVEVNLDKLRPSIRSIVFCISIHSPEKTFKDVTKAKIIITDSESGDELCSYALNEKFTTETAVVAGALENKNGDWEFKAIGNGYDGGLQTLVDMFT